MFSLNQFFHAIKYALRVTNYENIFLKVKQYQVIESVLLKRDTIGILATGMAMENRLYSILFHLQLITFTKILMDEISKMVTLF